MDKSGRLIEIVRTKFSNKFPIMKVDGEHCPTLDDMLSMKVICNNQLSGSCDQHNYQFSSHKDQQRHWILCHGGVPTGSYVKGQFHCNFQLTNEVKCNMIFDTNSALASHKRKENHTKHREKIVEENKNEDHNQKRNRLDIEEVEEGKRVKVWFDKRAKYYLGKAFKSQLCAEEYEFEMLWDDKRAKKHEIVTLLPKDQSDDLTNTDSGIICN